MKRPDVWDGLTVFLMFVVTPVILVYGVIDGFRDHVWTGLWKVAIGYAVVGVSLAIIVKRKGDYDD